MTAIVKESVSAAARIKTDPGLHIQLNKNDKRVLRLRKASVLLSVFWLIILAGCSKTKPLPPVQEPVSVPQVTSAPQEKPLVNTPVPEEEKPSETVQPAASGAVQPVKVVYREDDFLSWVAEDAQFAQTNVAALQTIDQVRYGTAGASLDMLAAAVAMLELDQEKDFSEALQVYLSGMTDIQRDYFSFQWTMVSARAEDLVTHFEEQKEFLKDINREDFVPSADALQKLEEQTGKVQKQLDAFGVSDSWRDYPDLEPFCYAALN